MFSPLTLSPQSDLPLYRQLYDEIRAAVLDGRLAPGARLPSSRELAAGMGLARSTVVSAFEQLLAEGYLEGRVGAGTFVATSLPEDLLGHGGPPARPPAAHERPAPRRLSARGAALAATPVSASSGDRVRPRAFQVGLPDIDGFPHATWARLAARRYGSPPPELMAYGDPAGYLPLREAIASHLAAARGVRCDPGQVVVVSGSQQGLDLAARVLLDPGDEAWIEDPGYMGARGALLAAGARLAPVPVDAEGLDVAAGARLAPQSRLAYITPSHQFPLGVTMSLPRRLALLAWARAAGAWVIEDDYDSEYRYAGRPLAALQGLDGDGRVIYLGTFSKVLFPALRLGYMVVPPDLVPAFVAARALADRHSPGIEQAIVADFLAEGHFARHLRRTRARYAARQAALVEAARPLAGRLDVAPAE
ncbi:PLP-dependent aminotransferase family protein, partial [Oscillochloris sp. ZM17-4]|uniref:MocR-like pyridoxine biosynthesis transcription factor PdxR n=1 Tax=Oscillochloris sp. ZM17-4 TaxID=2866714 RepID=UPI001C738C90